tara:strand:- start:2286 stop:3011 length:726 start_codon:yes stop_codon:yes gene_type:complete
VKQTEATELLQQQLGYKFIDESLFFQALSHTSYGHEYLQHLPLSQRNNERLEFLGDAVLDLVISDLLLEKYQDSSEGFLSKLRAAAVCEASLAAIARSLGVQHCLLLGKGEQQSQGHEKASILSCSFEALIAAIYLDGGFSKTYSVVERLFSPFLEEEDLESSFIDYKTQLQELLQAKWKITPTYHLIRSSGPDHSMTFHVEVRKEEEKLAEAEGSSKKQAEQNAAKMALLHMNESSEEVL